jgi:hypothetical protein
MKNIIRLTIIFSIFVLVSSCDKDYLNRFPEDSPNSSTYYKSADELVLAVNAAYNNLSFIQQYCPYQMLLDATADVMWFRPQDDIQVIGLGQHTPNTGIINRVWATSYTGIGRCNALLENMEKAKAVTTPALYARIEGEAKFLRAYYYGNLIALYGDVPLVDKTLKASEAFIARTPQATVLDFVFRDLDEAAVKLPVSHSGLDAGRATKAAALAFKARMALYYAKWDVAAAAAKEVMDQNFHSLYPNYRNLFTYTGEYSRESIFAFDYKQTVRTTSISQGNQSRLAGGFSTLIPTRALADSYECTDGLTIDRSPLYSTADPFRNRDPRMRQTLLGDGDSWFGTGGITYNVTFHPDSATCARLAPTTGRIANTEVTNAFSSFSGFVLKKYLDLPDLVLNTQCELAFMLIRYAEVLLTYAEARIEMNQIDATVLNAINQVRARAYGVGVAETTRYPAITTTNQAELRAIVRRERKVELAGEGLRLFDVRRWKIGEKVMNGILFGKALQRNLYYSLPKPTLDENSSPDYSTFNSLVAVAGNFKIMDNPRLFQQRHYLWPIPQAELDVNKNSGFTQNNGY